MASLEFLSARRGAHLDSAPDARLFWGAVC